MFGKSFTCNLMKINKHENGSTKVSIKLQRSNEIIRSAAKM